MGLVFTLGFAVCFSSAIHCMPSSNTSVTNNSTSETGNLTQTKLNEILIIKPKPSDRVLKNDTNPAKVHQTDITSENGTVRSIVKQDAERKTDDDESKPSIIRMKLDKMSSMELNRTKIEKETNASNQSSLMHKSASPNKNDSNIVSETDDKNGLQLSSPSVKRYKYVEFTGKPFSQKNGHEMKSKFPDGGLKKIDKNLAPTDMEHVEQSVVDQIIDREIASSKPEVMHHFLPSSLPIPPMVPGLGPILGPNPPHPVMIQRHPFEAMRSMFPMAGLFDSLHGPMPYHPNFLQNPMAFKPFELPWKMPPGLPFQPFFDSLEIKDEPIDLRPLLELDNSPPLPKPGRPLVNPTPHSPFNHRPPNYQQFDSSPPPIRPPSHDDHHGIPGHPPVRPPNYQHYEGPPGPPPSHNVYYNKKENHPQRPPNYQQSDGPPQSHSPYHHYHYQSHNKKSPPPPPTHHNSEPQEYDDSPPPPSYGHEDSYEGPHSHESPHQDYQSHPHDGPNKNFGDSLPHDYRDDMEKQAELMIKKQKDHPNSHTSNEHHHHHHGPSSHHGSGPSSSHHGSRPPSGHHGSGPSSSHHGSGPSFSHHGSGPSSSHHGSRPSSHHGSGPSSHHGSGPSTHSTSSHSSSSGYSPPSHTVSSDGPGHHIPDREELEKQAEITSSMKKKNRTRNLILVQNQGSEDWRVSKDSDIPKENVYIPPDHEGSNLQYNKHQYPRYHEEGQYSGPYQLPNPNSLNSGRQNYDSPYGPPQPSGVQFDPGTLTMFHYQGGGPQQMDWQDNFQGQNSFDLNAGTNEDPNKKAHMKNTYLKLHKEFKAPVKEHYDVMDRDRRRPVQRDGSLGYSNRENTLNNGETDDGYRPNWNHPMFYNTSAVPNSLENEDHSNQWEMNSHKGYDGNYQYMNNPERNMYEFGYRVGGPDHKLEHSHQTAGTQSKTKLNWEDDQGNFGEQYWEFNHSNEEHTTESHIK